MKLQNTPLDDCYILQNDLYEDERGHFFESFNKKSFYDLTGIEIDFVQDNQSSSKYGVLRGLHFQKGKFSQAKLIRVLEGEVLDVVVDLRSNSETYGKSFSVILNSHSNKQLFIPRGFAHGFIVLSKQATFFYKCDNYYNKESESGIIYNDKTLNIDWKIPKEQIKISEKDLILPEFKNKEK